MNRLEQIDYFYELMSELEDRIGGKRRLTYCTGKMNWPRRGVYFFYEPGENRQNTREARVVRVGTHALKQGSKTTLWNRLRQHRGTLEGTRKGGGNHRGSVFRRHVGSAIIRREKLENEYSTWGIGQSASRDIRTKEYQMERLVSDHIRSMPFLWVAINDPPGSSSQRGYIERNSIGLLSNYAREPIDPPLEDWLGNYCTSENVRLSGLWNSNHVDYVVNNDYLAMFEKMIRKI